MKFRPGMSFEHGGIQYRVLAGNRAQGDMVIEFKVDGWHRPHIAHTLILADFKGQVEENNYPQSNGYRGWRKLLERIRFAIERGWEVAAEKTANEANFAQSSWFKMWDEPFDFSREPKGES